MKTALYHVEIFATFVGLNIVQEYVDIFAVPLIA
jgi:hypothetical protein